MQHFKYSTLKKLHFYPEISYIKSFLRSNIKQLFTYPKSIYYSQRYNSGEKFLLRDTNIFPYFYNIHTNQQEESDPLIHSISLLTSTNESFILRYPNLKPNAFNNSDANKVNEVFQQNFRQLNNLITTRSDDKEKLDLPVVVFSRILYAATIANSTSSLTRKNLTLDQEGFELCVEKFLEKLEFADSESIANVMFSLSHFRNFESQIWELLCKALNEKLFVPEFTQVSPKEPHVFRYEDIDTKSAESDLLDAFGNKIFINGYLPVYLAYSSLKKASENGVNCEESLSNLSRRFSGIEKEIQNFNVFMFE